MSNGNDTQTAQQRRAQDRHNIYLPYLRELGAMAILAGVLYGVWDIFKNEGRLGIEVVEKQTAMIERLIQVQEKILTHLQRQEDNRRANVYSNPGIYGPPNPFTNRNRTE